jgi:hypothetical protein
MTDRLAFDYRLLNRYTVSFIFWALVSPTLQGQAGGHAHDQEAGQVGRVTFLISCRPAVLPAFEHGVALLHSFAYEASADQFREIARTDSTCAMAYWGIAMSLLHPVWPPPEPADLEAGKQTLDRARAVGNPSARERAYITALAAYFDRYATTPHPGRMLAYEAALERLWHRYPDDPEAAIFYALVLTANADPTDTTYARQRRADAILLPLFHRYPDHPGLAHYIIHANDSPPLAPIALPAARRYAEIAPAVPHAQHMPAHIFLRLGLWDEAIRSNAASASSAQSMEPAPHSDSIWLQRIHPLDYLTYAYLQEGRDSAAAGVLAEIRGYRHLYPQPADHHELATIPIRVAMERGDWNAAAALPIPPPGTERRAEALTRFARAVGAARSGDTAAARVEVRNLEDIERHFVGPLPRFSGPSMTILRLGASAWLAAATDDTLRAMQEADSAERLEEASEGTPAPPVPPAGEVNGEVLLFFNHPREAEAAFERTLLREPNRARTLFGCARAAELAHDTTLARTRYAQLVAVLSGGDGTRPELVIARRFLASR